MILVTFMPVAVTACSFTLTLEEALVITPVCKTEGKPRATDWPTSSDRHHHGDGWSALVSMWSSIAPAVEAIYLSSFCGIATQVFLISEQHLTLNHFIWS